MFIYFSYLKTCIDFRISRNNITVLFLSQLLDHSLFCMPVFLLHFSFDSSRRRSIRVVSIVITTVSFIAIFIIMVRLVRSVALITSGEKIIIVELLLAHRSSIPFQRTKNTPQPTLKGCKLFFKPITKHSNTKPKKMRITCDT